VEEVQLIGVVVPARNGTKEDVGALIPSVEYFPDGLTDLGRISHDWEDFTRTHTEIQCEKFSTTEFQVTPSPLSTNPDNPLETLPASDYTHPHTPTTFSTRVHNLSLHPPTTDLGPPLRDT
jgi:hypothetical protein